MTDKTIKDAVGNIAAMEYAGDMQGIFCLIIDKDGDFQQETCFPAELHYKMLAGLEIMKHDMVKHVLDNARTQKPRDI